MASNNAANDILHIARVKTISYEVLQTGDSGEATRLLDACCQDGFFYLDMSGTAPNIGETIDDIYTLEENLFSLPESELMQYDIDKLSPKKLNGYKPLGRNHGELAGRKDGFQSYAVPKDGIMRLGNQANFKRPQIVDAHMSSLHTFALAVSIAASTILSALSSSLKLQADEALQSIHNTHLPSPDLIRLLRYHAQAPSERGSSHIPHTDLGSLTFLFTKQFGLQILGAESGNWEWMEPRDGCAIVNIGDCLSLLTNTAFRSCRHRVSALPGQAMKERYSFAYFMRPDENALMRAVKSPLVSQAEKEDKEVFTSGAWLQRKYAMLRRDTWSKEKDWMLTGARTSKL